MWAEVALPLPLDRTFTYSVPESLSSQLQTGQTVLAPFRNRALRGIIVGLHNAPPPGLDPAVLKPLQQILSPQLVVPKLLLDLTRWIADTYACNWGEALGMISSAARTSARPLRRLPVDENLAQAAAAPTFALTLDQTRALGAVENALKSGLAKKFLLFGVTSSGKTEVYLRAMEKTLALGRQVIFLLPEISLCPPFQDILQKRFGPRVGLWHSQVTVREKNVLFEKILSGTVDIVLGARSALFAPLPNVGLIVMDEEHDPSYKQDEKPRYHAREAALKLAELHKAILLMGSATPAVDTFFRAEQGAFELLELPARVPTHQVPAITVADRRNGKSFTPFSDELIERVTQSLARREQVILALNRRGYSTFYLCHACGSSWKCPNCKLTLVHHLEEDGSGEPRHFLRCHFCFHERPKPDRCSDCGSPAVFLGGFGTQKLAQETRKLFPHARVVRLDGDAARRRTAAAEAYSAFKEETADILVGTQMVTQGYDFPRVTLVGIIDADTALHHPDFRAAERAFQWIAQASGRAGRSAMGGTVVVQSALPDHYALQSAARHDYRAFYAQELEFRRALQYPPFARLLLLRLESRARKDIVAQEAERLAETLRKKFDLAGGAGVGVLGPGPAPRENLRNLLRWQVLVKARDHASLLEAVRAVKGYSPKSGVRLVVDVDPQDML